MKVNLIRELSLINMSHHEEQHFLNFILDSRKVNARHQHANHTKYNIGTEPRLF